MDKQYDLIVVGGGPGGYVAAIRAAQLGFKTALVEREHLGGVCLNWGCIPTKALLRGAEVAHTLNTAADFGFSVENVKFDLAKLVGHSRAVSEKLTAGIEYLMKKNGVTVIEGEARLSGKCELTVATADGARTFKADHIILATGARARNLPGITVDEERIWSARKAMTPDELPQRLLVIGAGAIGVEFASLYRDLGSEVTLVEALNRILPAEDDEISALAKTAFTKRGIDVRTETTVTEVAYEADGVNATLRGPNGDEQIYFDRVILAVGITGNVENLGLEELGVKIDRNFIVTDEFGRTGVVGLYAIGDVAGPPWLAHKASHEGILCVERIAGIDGLQPLDPNRIPGCTYCRPQVASVGLTEQQARAAGYDIRVGRFRMAANGKALAIKDFEGLVKTIFDDRTGELLGAHMIGPEVTEQIQGFGIAKTLEATEHELKRAVFAHPTVSEAMHESVLDAFDLAIHQ